MLDIGEWRHVFKLDPEKPLGDEPLERICESGTDAVLVGGTEGITFDNTVELLGRVRRYTVPAVQEVSDLQAVVPGFDGYLIPLVLNARDPDWILAPHHRALKEYGALIHWEEVMVEGYVIANEHCSAAKKTKSEAPLKTEDIVAYARMADQMLRLPICYLEYSGAYGDPKTVEAVKAVLKNSRLFYGGGIRGVEQAKAMASVADTVIVGNVIYEDIEAALATVRAVKREN